jgi:hypothetical protein
MPYEITFKDLPAGYLAAAVQEGGQAIITIREFVSSEDGDGFVTRLEGIPSQIISMLPSETRIKPSIVDHLLAIIRNDKTATVYVNELTILSDVIFKGRDINRGDPVYVDDIADILRVRFLGVEIPKDAGVLFLFSEGWRKGLFYDFKPLSSEEAHERDYDLEILLGQYYAYLGFQQLFRITDDQWNNLIAQKWFPFISLKRETIKKIISYAENGWNIDKLTDAIADEVSALIPAFLNKWERSNVFKAHFPLLKQATDRFIEKDYISATSILYPRIEGLMRTYHLGTDRNDRVTQSKLVASVLQARANERHAFSLLLPGSFRRYLEDVYFADFDPSNAELLSRHTVSHGVAPAEFFSLKGAVIGLLLLDQLSFYIRSQGQSDEAVATDEPTVHDDESHNDDPAPASEAGGSIKPRA